MTNPSLFPSKAIYRLMGWDVSLLCKYNGSTDFIAYPDRSCADCGINDCPICSNTRFSRPHHALCLWNPLKIRPQTVIIIIIKPRLTGHMSVTKEDESQRGPNLRPLNSANTGLQNGRLCLKRLKRGISVEISEIRYRPGLRRKNPRRKNEFVGVNIAPPLPLFSPELPI